MLKYKLLDSMKLNASNIALKYNGRVYKYSEIRDIACYVANRLIEEKNKIDKKETNACLLLNHDDVGVICIIACVLADITYVPLDSSYPIERLRIMEKNCESSFIIANNDNYNLAKKISRDVINIEELIRKCNKKEKLNDSSSQKYVYCLHTSGTTGIPKSIGQKSESICYYVDRYIKNLNITSEDNMTLFSSFSHDAAIMDIYSAFICGASLYPRDLKVIKNLLTLENWLVENKITIWHSVPSLYRKFFRHCNEINKDTCLRIIVLGGEKIITNDYMILKKLFLKKDVKMYSLYGQTESSYNSGMYIEKEEDIGKIGRVNDGIKMYIMGEKKELINIANFEDIVKINNNDLQEGEILISSEYTVDKYLTETEKNNDSFIYIQNIGTVYRTGDYGKIINKDIRLIGRKDSQIKINGYRVELSEIENYLLRYKGIKECVVINLNENKLYAFVVSEHEVSLVEINKFLSRYLPSYMLLYDIVKINEIPMTVSGKADRSNLYKMI